MRSANGRDFVPEDGATGFAIAAHRKPTKLQIFHALRVQMNFAAILVGQPLEQLG
jgi:hypothetical protein